MTRFLALGLLLSISASARADPGVDLLVLLDCSKSMAHQPRSERLLLRMTADMLARNAAANRLEHRLAVIRFGSAATVDLPFTPVRRLGRRLDGIGYEDRGETDIVGALEKAKDLFRSLTPTPERRRAIVLLTDGVPYVRGRDSSAYRASLARYLARSEIPVDVLLTDARAQAFWRGHAHVELTEGAPVRLLASAHGVIARLAGTQTGESAPLKTREAVDTLLVPPYLDLIVFDIFRPAPDVAVDVFPPGSETPIRPGGDGIELVPLGAVLTTLAVPRPAAGQWTVRKSRADGRVRILSQQFFPRGTLLRPDQSESPRRCDRLPLIYRIRDGGGKVFEELRDYRLTLEVTLTKPGGGSTTIAMERDPSLGAGAFRSAQEVTCDLPGRYWTDVRITTVETNGRRLDVFRDRWSGFSVTPGVSTDCRAQRAEARLGALRVAAPAGKPRRIALLVLAAVIALAVFVSFLKTKS